MNEDFQKNLSQFLNAYIESALWAETDDNGAPLDLAYTKDDIDADSIMLMTVDCYNFYHNNFRNGLPNDYTYAQAGHDFWLTRNGHGVGYWDRGLGRNGEVFTTRAQNEGEVYLFVENNKVYCS